MGRLRGCDDPLQLHAKRILDSGSPQVQIAVRKIVVRSDTSRFMGHWSCGGLPSKWRRQGRNARNATGWRRGGVKVTGVLADDEPHFAADEEGVGLKWRLVKFQDLQRRPGNLDDFIVALGAQISVEFSKFKLHGAPGVCQQYPSSAMLARSRGAVHDGGLARGRFVLNPELLGDDGAYDVFQLSTRVLALSERDAGIGATDATRARKGSAPPVGELTR